MASTRRAKRPVLGQRYRLIRQLDAGGMGSVWLAEAVHLRSLVAVKIMDRSLAATPEAAQRFLREARTSASLRSPHVVQILDYGVHDSTPFIAMELLEGESLASRLQREGRLASWEQTELVVRHVARALGRAHDAGVIHRDLKPGNIFLVRDEEEEIVKLLDFGIAKTTLSPLGAPLGSDTRTGEFLGSPAYASPEQLQASKALDHRADIWSLGVIAYECLLGRKPFVADSFVVLLLEICTGALPVPSEQGPVPAGFDAWFARACARDVEQRFQSVREASAELRRLVAAARGARPAFAASTSHAAELAPSEPLPDGVSSVPLLDGASSAPLPDGAPSEPVLDGAPSRPLPDGAPSRPLPDGAPSRPLPDGAPSAPLPDGAPSTQAPRSRTAPMTLVPAPIPLAVPVVAPLYARTDTVRLVVPEVRLARRRRQKTLTVIVALSAVVALVFFTVDASNSRAALDWRRFALNAGPPSGPASGEAPEGASDAPPDRPERGAPPPSFAPPARGPSPAPESAKGNDEFASSTVAAPNHVSGLSVAPDANAPPERSSSAALDEAALDRAEAPDPAAAPALRRSPSPRPPSASSSARSKSARLTITASAPAQVWLDGVPLGTAPLEAIRVEPGVHEIAFIQDGKRSAEMLTIRSGEHKRVEARIDPPPGDGLDEAAVKRTIKRHRGAVLDTCSDHAFGARAPGDPPSVRVPVTISVEASGVVRSVSTRTEPPGYVDLRRCIEERVAAWRFPRARAETVVNVAFVFVGLQHEQ